MRIYRTDWAHGARRLRQAGKAFVEASELVRANDLELASVTYKQGQELLNAAIEILGEMLKVEK
jgi:hypothetical protein